MSLNDLDEDVLAQFTADVGGAADELVRLFADETRQRITRMMQADDNTKDAHSLKSTAATYGMSGLARAADALDTACTDGDDKRASEHLIEIETGVEEALKGLLNTLARSAN